ncbi:MAG: hypothetical protein J6C32_06680, partial [Eubacterium sp.]|nr:hypothetical protein [Eubacterium sp.]
MNTNLRKMIGYYKPYMKTFWLDMLFAALSAGVALVIPLVVRYVTSTLFYLPSDEILHQLPFIMKEKTYKLAFGSVGYRLSTRLILPKEIKPIIENLRKRGMMYCLSTEVKV